MPPSQSRMRPGLAARERPLHPYPAELAAMLVHAEELALDGCLLSFSLLFGCIGAIFRPAFQLAR